MCRGEVALLQEGFDLSAAAVDNDDIRVVGLSKIVERGIDDHLAAAEDHNCVADSLNFLQEM